MTVTLRLILLALLAFFVLCVLLVHLRGRTRLRFAASCSTTRPVRAVQPVDVRVLGRAGAADPGSSGFPQLDVLQAIWQIIRDEATAPVRRGLHPRRGQGQRRQLRLVLQAGLEALLSEMVRRAAALGRTRCARRPSRC